MIQTAEYRFFASCAKGIEQVLETELQTLGANHTKTSVAGVHFTGDSIEIALKACLWSRCASRILMPLFECEDDADILYQHCLNFEWHQHMLADNSLWINFVQGVAAKENSTQAPIRHSLYGSQLIKDAICDHFNQRGEGRPSVEKHSADITIQARSHRGTIGLSLDLSGCSLHRRGYRSSQGEAPIRETLAATLLYRAKWQSMTDVQVGQPATLIDPMCGSATLLIEAAMIALAKAPALDRQPFGFEAWLQLDRQLWQKLHHHATECHQQACQTMARQYPHWKIYGFDSDHRQIARATDNIQRAGLSQFIELEQRSIDDNKNLKSILSKHPTGLCITNPPYGERLGEVPQLEPIYRQLGSYLKQLQGWQGAVIVSDKWLGKALDIHSHKQYKVYNGAIECQLLLLELQPQNFIDAERKRQFSPESQMVLNRLRKNYSKIKGWLKQQRISCYRLYDADLPEYAAAVDIYDQHCLLQIYRAPKTIDPNKASFRERQLIKAVQAFALELDIAQQNIHLRSRQQQKGKSQYQPSGVYSSYNVDYELDYYQITESELKYNVNFDRYLDTGLFLDHRPLRRWLMSQSNDKKVLNLFSYTASLSLAAAKGGARSTLSVDMSNTYLRWAEDNFQLNHLKCHFNKRSIAENHYCNGDSGNNQLLKTECIAWLQQQFLNNYPQQFDIIIVDPPSFSNSKSMAQTLDILRDHANLINLIMPMLNDEGLLYFSTNHRRFKLDVAISERYNCQNLTADSIDKDFQVSQHSKHCHQLWLLQHKQ